MSSGIEYDVLMAGIRALFYIGLPVLLAVTLVGTVVSALQSATTIQEPAIGYAARVAGLVILLYLMFPAFARTVMNLAELAFH